MELLSMIFMILILKSYSSQILFYEAFSSVTYSSIQDWTTINALGSFTNCGGTQIFGGYDTFGMDTKVMKLISLPPHFEVQINLRFWKIDTWDSEDFYIYIDGILAFSQQYTSDMNTQMCGILWGDETQSISISLPHVYQTILIFMTAKLDEPLTNESWGFSDFQLFLSLCPPNCVSCSSRDSQKDCIEWSVLVSAFLDIDYLTFTEQGWQIENGVYGYSNCNGIPIFCGVYKCGTTSRIKKTINLPTHSKLMIRFRLAFFDSWDNEFFYLYVDGNLVFSQQHFYYQDDVVDVCGVNNDDYLPNFEVIIDHTNPLINIDFTTSLDESSMTESFGFRDFQIFSKIKKCGNGVQELHEQCDDGNIYAFDGCFNCQYSCVEGCSNCIDGICFECQIGWIFESEFNICQAIVDDTKIQIWEECDDQLNFEICNNGKFICQTNCKICQFGICLKCKSNFELINNKCETICQNQLIVNDLQCLDYNLEAFDQCHQCYYDLEEGCKLQENGICIECLDGWKLDMPNYICIPICGDLIIKGNEQCDIDKYSKSKTGCNQCLFNCQKECLNCEYGICLDCITGWKLINQKCESICGDNQIQGLEECDDMNSIRFDGCNQCKNECQRECSYCYAGTCLDCIYGWHLNNSFICESECGDSQIALISNECYNCECIFTLIDQLCILVCGDGLVTVGYEECDDMNQIPYDGCYECYYQCRENCKLCIKGICQDYCEYGFYQVENECLPECGDGIKAGQEDCDDQNEDKSDGCFNCQFYCPDYCDVCLESQCQQCESGYALIQQKNICQSYCGNGITSLTEEECDDGNNDDGDGCSRLCKIEEDYQCRNFEFSFSQCTYSKQPRFYLQFKEEKDQNQYVSLLFTQQVKNIVRDQYSKYITMNLVDLDINIYKLNLIIIQEAVDQVANVEYIVEIQINATLNYRPILTVTLNEQLYNSEDAMLFNQNDQIQLKQVEYIDDQKQEAAAALQKASEYIMNSMGGIGVIAFFLGNSFIFSSILEVLQQQSYLRFINVIFPFNLFIYFESSNIISTKPILQFFQIDSIQSSIYDSIYIESYEKLKFYQINADLLTNIQTQIFLILILFIVYQLCGLIVYLIDKLSSQSMIFIGKFGIKFLLSITKKCIKYKKDVLKEGVKVFLIANCWDLLFTCFLQLKSWQPYTTFRSIICLILAYILFYGCLIIVSQFVNKNSFIKSSFRSYWISKMDLFFTLKKLIFIFILVCFQKNQQIQTILLTFVCQLYLSYAIKFKPVKNQLEFYNLIIMVGSAFIFTLTSTIYWSFFDNLISQECKLFLGWFHIIMLLLVLLINLIIQLYVVIRQLISIVKIKICKQQKLHLSVRANPFPLVNAIKFKL